MIFQNPTKLPETLAEILGIEGHYTQTVVIDHLDAWVLERAERASPEAIRVVMLRSSAARVSIRTLDGLRILVWDKEFFLRFQQLLSALFVPDADLAKFAFWNTCDEIAGLMLLHEGHVVAASAHIAAWRKRADETKAYWKKLYDLKKSPDPRVWRMVNYGRLFAFLHEEGHHSYRNPSVASSLGAETSRLLEDAVADAENIEAVVQGRADYRHIALWAPFVDRSISTLESVTQALRGVATQVRALDAGPSFEEAICDVFSIRRTIELFPPTTISQAALLIEGIACTFDLYDVLELLRRQYVNLATRRPAYREHDQHQSGVRNAFRRYVAFREVTRLGLPKDSVTQETVRLHDAIQERLKAGFDHTMGQMRAFNLFAGGFWLSAAKRDQSLTAAERREAIDHLREYFLLNEAVRSREGQQHALGAMMLSAAMTFVPDKASSVQLDLDHGATLPTSISTDTTHSDLWALLSSNARGRPNRGVETADPGKAVGTSRRQKRRRRPKGGL